MVLVESIVTRMKIFAEKKENSGIKWPIRYTNLSSPVLPDKFNRYLDENKEKIQGKSRAHSKDEF